MTYVSKGEKIFTMPNRIFGDCTLPKIKRSDGRLKKYSSIWDERVWSLDEKQRYRYFRNIMGGSQACISVSSCFKFVPLEEIINILLADRDAYIKCLEKRLGLGVPTEETSIDELYKAGCFEDEEEQDVLSMRNKIEALTAELEECKSTRDTLRQAMHKLEDIDEIINENECLKNRLRCSEEMIKYLQEKKCKLEKELENLRTKSEIQMDLQNTQETLKETIQKQRLADGEDHVLLSQERDILQRRVCELQNELRDAKSKQSELELLKKQSESTTVSLEEMARENECYKKKLESMKCLEKQIQELKKQANLLAEKYKRDACKASDKDRQIRNICSELRSLREERDRLKRRVDELACYECQYNSFQCKLQQIDCIIAENEMLNCKLASLDKLEVENQYLRNKLEQCQASEVEAAESKERIIELQNAVADQEEEMKDLLCQIERLTRAYGDSDELDRLKEELCEKDCKLKLCEEQLAEIPLLEAEIDELRSKLENCYNNIAGPAVKLRKPGKITREGLTDSNEGLSIIETRYEEDVDFEAEPAAYEEINMEEAAILEKMDGEKGSMTCEEVQTLLESSKGIINCVLEDMLEHQTEMEELEKCNQEMKEEIYLLKAKMGKTDMDDCLQQVAELRRTIQEKELKICCLETQILKGGDVGKVNDHISNLECEIEYLKELNRKMRADLEEARCEIQRCAELECMMEEEMSARKDFGKQLESRRSKKSQKEEFNLEAKVSSTPSVNEIDDMKNEVETLKNLVEELKKENSALKEMQTPCPDYVKEMDEKEALENLLNLLQCELDSCRQGKFGDDCEELRSELKRLEGQNCQLKSLVNCYKERLDLDRCSREESGSLKKSGSSCLQDENNRLRREKTRLRCELVELCKRIQNNEKKICEQEDEIEELKACCKSLVKRNDELEKEVDEKDNESQNLKGEVSKLLDQTYKLSSDNDVLKHRLDEAETPHPEVRKEDYETDLTEKHAVESAMRNLEEEVDGLKMRLEECGKAELERNNLLKKQVDMEAEMERLRKQLSECKEGESKALKEPKFVPPPPVQAPPPTAQSPAEVKPSGPSPEEKTIAEAKAKEEKLLGEMAGIREQAGKLLAEVNEAKAENKKLKNEIDELKKLLDQCNKEKDHEAAHKQADKLQAEANEAKAKEEKLVREMAGIREQADKLQAEANEAKAKEEKLVREMAGIRERADKLQAEANEAKAENKKLKNEIDELKKLLDQCNKEKAHEAAQASLMSSKLQGVSYPVPPQAQGIPQTVIPIKEEQRTSVYDRVQGEVTQAVPGAKVAFIEDPTPKKLVKVVAEAENFKNQTPSKEDKPKMEIPAKPKTDQPSPTKAEMNSPKATSAALPKAGGLTPSKAAILTPSKAAVLTPSKMGMAPESMEGKLPKEKPSESAVANSVEVKREELATSASDESTISFSDIDPDFAKFLCSLNPANHKQNICEIERRYGQKMCELQKKHEDKVKRLLEQQEKEGRMRDKAYNDSIGTMRSGYETDIRKLVERHKASIMRLQNLHEDEVYELNVKYETQMEAMQTQNENVVHDLTTGAREKFKMLAEQHNKDVRDLERKYEELLEKKENQHVLELSKLKLSMAQNMDKVEEYHNRTMNDMTTALQGNIADIQTKHSSELRKLKKSNLKRIDIVRHKYEDLLTCERKKYERQLEEMVQRLRQGKALADGICQCRLTAPCGPKDPNAPIDFNEVLQKILTEGLESLTFNEVALVHKRTCAATEDIVLKPEVTAQLQPPIKDDSCVRNQLMKANREELLNRILILEDEIAVKQKETQNAIVSMEMAVKAERRRLQELRDSLRNERGKNSEITLPVPKITSDIRSAFDLQCVPVPDKNRQKTKVIQEDKFQPLVLEMEDVKILHKGEAHSERKKRKMPTGDCNPKHKGTKRKLKK